MDLRFIGLLAWLGRLSRQRRKKRKNKPIDGRGGGVDAPARRVMKRIRVHTMEVKIIDLLQMNLYRRRKRRMKDEEKEEEEKVKDSSQKERRNV